MNILTSTIRSRSSQCWLAELSHAETPYISQTADGAPVSISRRLLKVGFDSSKVWQLQRLVLSEMSDFVPHFDRSCDKTAKQVAIHFADTFYEIRSHSLSNSPLFPWLHSSLGNVTSVLPTRDSKRSGFEVWNLCSFSSPSLHNQWQCFHSK